MESRIERHADIIINHSVEVESGDNVLIAAPPKASKLVKVLNKKIGEKNAVPLNIRHYDEELETVYKQGVSEGKFPEPDHFISAVKASDIYIGIKAPERENLESEISSKASSKYEQARKGLLKAQIDSKWTVTHHPTKDLADRAGMKFEEYKDFYYDAVERDWDAVKNYQSQLADIIENSGSLEIRSGEETSLEIGIDGMHSGQENGTKNLPGSEVATAPVIDSVNGEVKFDFPVRYNGKKIEGVNLVFEDGEVIDYSADKNEDVLESILNTDDGARRLGEVGFGMNDELDQFTDNIYLDEKMANTVHLALGQAYEEEVGKSRKVNESAVHVDMIIDMSTNSEIKADGQIIYRNGKYIFDEGFSDK